MRQKQQPLDARLAFRLPQDVAEDWRRRAERAGLSLSDFVRRAVDADQITGIAAPSKRRPRRTYTPADPALIRNLAWIGNNLNQIARWVNTYKSGVDSVELLAHLNALRRDFLSLLPQPQQKREETDAD
jgi:hypothetical protein